MTDYENRLIKIYNTTSLDDLRELLKENNQRAIDAANKMRETGLSKFKEDKENHATRCNVLKFVIANREFYDVDTVINEVN